MGMDQRNAGQHFEIRLCGGRWTAENLGRAFDSYKAECCSASAKAFCEGIGVQKSFKNDIRTHGDEIAHALCKLWQHRMMHLFRHWTDVVDMTDALNGYVEPQDQLAIVTRSTLKRTLDRLEAIRRVGA